MNKLFALFFSFLLIFSSCHRAPEDIEPKISYAVQDTYLKRLPSPFKPLTPDEKSQSWGKEYQIGIAFAHQLDLYQSITAFKRAEILVPPESNDRKLEMQYEILLCYYLGKKYSDVVDSFQKSDLRFVNADFPAFHDLLVILYESYSQTGEDEKADQTLDLIKHCYPDTGTTIEISTAMEHADLPKIENFSEEKPYLQDFLNEYNLQKKSAATAQTLNAFIPGAGYLYLGQGQSAFTAFFLNGLFIAAACELFIHKQLAAGVIVTSFEAGWYFGGIHGAGLETKYYNERLYERMATPLMNEKGLFPILTLNYAF